MLFSGFDPTEIMNPIPALNTPLAFCVSDDLVTDFANRIWRGKTSWTHT